MKIKKFSALAAALVVAFSSTSLMAYAWADLITPTNNWTRPAASENVFNNDVFTIIKEIDIIGEDPWYSPETNYPDMSNYNDGLKIGGYTIDEYTTVPALYDIEGNLVYYNPVWYDAMAHGYWSHSFDYNLGWLMEQRFDPFGDTPGASWVTFINVFTGEIHHFEGLEMAGLTDVTIYNDGTIAFNYDGTYYLAQLKTPMVTSVFLNGEKIYFDQLPVIENGRTLVPLRAIFEKLGAQVGWDDATSTVTAAKDGTTINLTIGSTTAYKNGQPIIVDVPAKTVNGRTLVPVRFIADCFGITTNWDGDKNQVLLTTN